MKICLYRNSIKRYVVYIVLVMIRWTAERRRALGMLANFLENWEMFQFNGRHYLKQQVESAWEKTLDIVLWTSPVFTPQTLVCYASASFHSKACICASSNTHKRDPREFSHFFPQGEDIAFAGASEQAESLHQTSSLLLALIWGLLLPELQEIIWCYW